tara:strand:- start:13870 stop:15198 length:1329 start_codon:yes stop_codon:yes gene_type:complete
MRNIFYALILSFIPWLTIAQGINFEKGTFNEALAKAKVENKLLFIDGYAVWCAPCKKMDKTVFLEKEVGAYFNKNFIALKVDVERGEGPFLKKKYDIEGLPGYVFIDGNGHVVYRFSSAMPTAKFMKEVQRAVLYSKDLNSIGRLAERYETEKDDEKVVGLYLEKLKESKSKNYVDVLEHYLNIQKNIKESSKEMVVLLANHSNEVIFGGKADEIFQRNYGSDAWKLYVRKDIREKYQRLKRRMVQNTTNYAIVKRDTTILEKAIENAATVGYKTGKSQRNRTYTYYYYQTGNGEKYKKMVKIDNELFIKSINVKKRRNHYLNWQKRKKAGEKKALRSRPYSIRLSQNVSSMVYSYANFVKTAKEKEDVLRWMKVAYDIIPGDAKIMSEYANILYLFGNDKPQAIKLKEEAYRIAVKEGVKTKDAMRLDLNVMRKGKIINLK